MVDAPIAVVLLGKGTGVGLLMYVEPPVVVTLVNAVAFVMSDAVMESFAVVSDGVVRLPKVNAFAEEMFAIGNIMIKKMIMPDIECDRFLEIFTCLTCSRLTYLNIP